MDIILRVAGSAPADQTAAFADVIFHPLAFGHTQPLYLWKNEGIVVTGALEQLLVEDEVEAPVAVLQLQSNSLERVETIHLRLHLGPPGIDEGDLRPRRRRVK